MALFAIGHALKTPEHLLSFVAKLAGDPQVREWQANRLPTFLPRLVQSRKRMWCCLCFAFEKGSSPMESDAKSFKEQGGDVQVVESIVYICKS